MSDPGPLVEVKMRALFLAEGLRDYMWVLTTTDPRAPFVRRMEDVVGDKARRLTDALERVRDLSWEAGASYTEEEA